MTRLHESLVIVSPKYSNYENQVGLADIERCAFFAPLFTSRKEIREELKEGDASNQEDRSKRLWIKAIQPSVRARIEGPYDPEIPVI